VYKNFIIFISDNHLIFYDFYSAIFFKRVDLELTDSIVLPFFLPT